MSNTGEHPKLLPHEVGEGLVKHASILGYGIRSLTLVYYVGMDEVVTTIKQSDDLWECNVKDDRGRRTNDT